MFYNTGWAYATSSGGSITAGPLVEVTAQQATLYLNSPNGDQYKIIGAGVGGGVGLSFIPVTISGSSTDYVSGGSSLYSIYNQNIMIGDLSDIWLIYSGNFNLFNGIASGAMVMFIKNPNLLQWALLAIPALWPTLITSDMVKAFCFIGSTQMAIPNAGVDATGTFYAVATADVVTQ